MKEEQKTASETGVPAKRPYAKPAIRSQEIFETTALSCGKLSGQGAACNYNVRLS